MGTMTEMSRDVWRSRVAALLGKDTEEKLALYETATDEELADRLRDDPVLHAMWRREFPGAYPA